MFLDSWVGEGCLTFCVSDFMLLNKWLSGGEARRLLANRSKYSCWWLWLLFLGFLEFCRIEEGHLRPTTCSTFISTCFLKETRYTIQVCTFLPCYTYRGENITLSLMERSNLPALIMTWNKFQDEIMVRPGSQTERGIPTILRNFHRRQCHTGCFSLALKTCFICHL